MNITKPFLCTLPAWVLTFRDKDGYTCIGKQRTEAGLVLTCYLSPLDAAIEAAWLTRTGLPHDVMPASEVNLGMFLTGDASELVAAIHIGWPARDGHVLMHASGRPGRICRLMRQPFSMPPPAPRFDLDELTLASVGYQHEKAGLFAWRESMRDVSAWPRDACERRRTGQLEASR